MNVYKGRLLKISSNHESKIEARPVNATLVTGCKLWLQSIQNHAWHRFQPLCAAIWSRCAVWFESEQTPFPQTGRRLRPAACTGLDSEHVVLFLCHILTQRPMTDGKIERSDGCGFGRQQLLAYFIEIFSSHKKRVTRCGTKFTEHWNLVDSRTESVSQEW